MRRSVKRKRSAGPVISIKTTITCNNKSCAGLSGNQKAYRKKDKLLSNQKGLSEGVMCSPSVAKAFG